MPLNRNCSDKKWRLLLKLTGGQCWFCGIAAPDTVDHGKPISKGGSNFIDNLYPACARCNGKKQASDVEEFRAWLGDFYYFPQRQQSADMLYQQWLTGKFYGEMIGVSPQQLYDAIHGRRGKSSYQAGPIAVSTYSMGEKLKSALGWTTE